jgi:hypothetical protein
MSGKPELEELAEYLRYKSANCERGLAIWIARRIRPPRRQDRCAGKVEREIPGAKEIGQRADGGVPKLPARQPTL